MATVKPSKAAMELAEALFPDFTAEIHIGYADIIHSHLADLLEKAGTVAGGYHTQSDLDALAAALELWRKA